MKCVDSKAAQKLSTVQEALQHHSLGHDLRLKGWDDFDTAPHLQTPLTVVDQPDRTKDEIPLSEVKRIRL